MMLDPFVDGRAGGGGEGFSASAAGTQGRESGMLAYADGQTLPILKGPPPAPIYTPRWSAWGAAYGGVSNTDGNAATGSNRLNANTFGFAGGMDYHVSPETLFGFALAGGGTNWNLASVSGSGRSTALQAGVYAITYAGPLYGAADFGFTNNWFDTDRNRAGRSIAREFRRPELRRPARGRLSPQQSAHRRDALCRGSGAGIRHAGLQ
ncbi:MAG: autotransporter outer membrane beta-barrel domain-containing protein [Methylovirgula sp.]